MTDTAPSGTPQPHRRRRRDLGATPALLLEMLLSDAGARLDPDLAATACRVSRQTVLQGICRLRDQGLVIQTYPEPPGPHPVQYYKLDDFARSKAWELLAWWSEILPEFTPRFRQPMPKEPTPHEPPTHPPKWTPEAYRTHDINDAHDQAIQEDKEPHDYW